MAHSFIRIRRVCGLWIPVLIRVYIIYIVTLPTDLHISQYCLDKKLKSNIPRTVTPIKQYNIGIVAIIQTRLCRIYLKVMRVPNIDSSYYNIVAIS